MPRTMIFLTLLLIAVFPVAGEENLFRNPGFEDVTGSRARFWDALPGSAGAAVSGEKARDGRYCLEFRLQKPQTAGVFQRVRVKAGTLYRLTLRVKTENLAVAGPGAHIHIPGLNALSNDFSGTTDGWQKAVLFVRTDAGQTELEAAARVGAPGQPAAGLAWFDEFVMEEAGEEAMSSLAGNAPSAPFPWGLLVFALAAALLLALFARLYRKNRPPLKGPLLDLVLAGGLTLVYAFIAFWNLGSFDAPQTYYRAEREGEGFCVDLGERVPIAKLNCFLALGAGSFDLDFSNDLVSWRERKTIAQDNQYSMIEWRTVEVGASARYIRVTAVKPGVMLGEIGAFRRDTGALAPARGVVAAAGRRKPATDPAAVCDEPGRVPATPSYRNSMYFDETYHARAAYEYVLGRDSSETTHPPLGKLTIASGVLAFGFDPSGWRFTGTLTGVLMVPLMYAFGLALFKQRRLAFTGAFLFAFDFMHFVQTRIATIDVYGVFWILLMYYFMYRALKENPFARRPKKYFLFLFLSGLSFGLGAASKWIALYGAIGLAVAFLIGFFYRLVTHVFRFVRSQTGAQADKAAEDADLPPNPGRAFARFFVSLAVRIPVVAAFSGLVFLLLPALVYFASYLPFLAVRGASLQYGGPIDFLVKEANLVLKEQEFMFNYHATLQATHHFSSPWYEWPVMARPIWYYSGKPHVPDNLTSSIAAFGNPAVWWPGALAAIALIVILSVLFALLVLLAIALLLRTIKRKNTDWIKRRLQPVIKRLRYFGAAGGFILVALAAQYLPWIVVPRKLTFIYHFFASVPFLVFCIVYFLKLLLEKRPRARWVLVAYLAVALSLFLLFYPALSGWPAETWYVERVLRWFPGWVF